jgi:hypothetical protein
MSNEIMKQTYAEKKAKQKAEIDILKPLMIAECKRIVQLLENNVEESRYGFGEYNASELFAKLHELRRDSINFERVVKRL